MHRLQCQFKKNANDETREQLATLKYFLPFSEKMAILEHLKGEEGNFCREKIAEMAARVEQMPKTYEQDGLGADAIAYLHYFRGDMDWYITEKDMEHGPQHQAFGSANLGYGAELGYISIQEIISTPGAEVELDLYFEPCTLRNIKNAAA